MFEFLGIVGISLLGTGVVLSGFWCGWKLVDTIWRMK
jgi:hypothetical protein